MPTKVGTHALRTAVGSAHPKPPARPYATGASRVIRPGFISAK